VKCTPSCRKSETTSSSPAKPAKNTMPTTRPEVKARLRSRLGAMSACSPERRSTAAKTPSSAQADGHQTKVQIGQPSSRPWTSG
jgi:hypothetical protein